MVITEVEQTVNIKTSYNISLIRGYCLLGPACIKNKWIVQDKQSCGNSVENNIIDSLREIQ